MAKTKEKLTPEEIEKAFKELEDTEQIVVFTHLKKHLDEKEKATADLMALYKSINNSK